ncbi:hypothetical protein B0P06_001082 [Clostridium saccharoperbutylacetonicum]|jgi:hypothetical protein|uniref:Uncharacterized protein n=1 Tax=Clostridium saccharoperbutylacetonicum N1-4(HMT) TaxID=931276 RepID=M1LPQ6_9CLOT|nr:hypothetical protein [Clostridium saccharoperbutylacetonicum]AGF54840.1 hypothetical protein Cspa_c10640 [Clostridium saccharoperbutylacetonicum N1-4(HMT)]NRT64455.1 hypothetical protein [Clostridium saccharoperbutylacetonicum]NSB27826.1 hypothetical protein [Clostridium saccharoperbutylacetonicum]NSB41311.1 hypothetical protein [Clostridium saccharoperbutylacetonicum]
MKSNEIFKSTLTALKDSFITNDKIGLRVNFQYPFGTLPKNEFTISTSLRPEDDNGASDVSIPVGDNKDYTEANSSYNKQQSASSNPQGVIDSITQELTSVKLQQAIILSEIVGKPRSKTRRQRRRF